MKWCNTFAWHVYLSLQFYFYNLLSPETFSFSYPIPPSPSHQPPIFFSSPPTDFSISIIYLFITFNLLVSPFTLPPIAHFFADHLLSGKIGNSNKYIFQFLYFKFWFKVLIGYSERERERQDEKRDWEVKFDGEVQDNGWENSRRCEKQRGDWLRQKHNNKMQLSSTFCTLFSTGDYSDCIVRILVCLRATSTTRSIFQRLFRSFLKLFLLRPNHFSNFS